MKVPRKAWQPGALWVAKTKRGTLEGIIMGLPNNHKQNYKYVHMNYVDGSYSNQPVQQDYSHAHMLKHLKYTRETRDVPEEISYANEYYQNN